MGSTAFRAEAVMAEKHHKSRSVMSWAGFVVFASAFLYQTYYDYDNEMSAYGLIAVLANFCVNKTAQIIKTRKENG